MFKRILRILALLALGLGASLALAQKPTGHRPALL